MTAFLSSVHARCDREPLAAQANPAYGGGVRALYQHAAVPRRMHAARIRVAEH